MKKHKFNTPWDSDYWMNSNGFFCGFNMPDALKSQTKDGEEILQNLPPFEWRKSFLVDEYPAHPNDWMPSKGRLTSYFVPILEGKGMWLDFRKNADKTHDVAIVVSVQGVNAITGLACKDEKLHLEQYIDNCPKHNKPFGPNRLCEEEGCGYKWPKQNYICTTGTPNGLFWLDGFRAANGAVQQYILTEQTMRGVAANVIGSKRVFAIGISFFLSKTPKPQRNFNTPNLMNSGSYIYGQPQFFSPVHTPINWVNFDECCATVNENEYEEKPDDEVYGSIADDTIVTHHAFNVSTSEVTKSSTLTKGSAKRVKSARIHSPSYTPIRTKNIEVGAGASIRQSVYDDPEPLEYWRDKPEALLCINYALEEEVIKIIKQGKVNKQGHPKGFLKDVPVGN